MDPLLANHEVRSSYRKALSEVQSTVYRLNTLQIDPEEAEKAGIHQLRMSKGKYMSLDQSSPDRPYFFTTYQGSIDKLNDPDILATWSDYQPDSEISLNTYGISLFFASYLRESVLEHPPGVYSQQWGGLNFGNLFESLETGYHWKVHRTCLALTTFRMSTGSDEPLPHIKCLIESEAISDDRLLRGELMAIIKIMIGRLDTKSLDTHIVAPVMLLSVMGPQHVRMLETYFNGVELVVRQSRLYDMRKFDLGVLERFTRWWFGYAIGETKAIA
ncbi:hypothetical protein ETB97_008248 [Aspergillus alliaceus]|uniref:Uncharacterized protein n=1 Tax=Petromyces alliaceus TaxID=209559 RepID=A0A8H6A999_PETAA|nr:hypothetical protein ETB97_008248 [Aspergillus burnettii]